MALRRAVIAYPGRGTDHRASLPVRCRGALARSLPAGKHVLNVCADRYRFAVGLAACLITERISLLPSTHTPEVIGQLSGFAPDAFCLTDDPRCDIDLPGTTIQRSCRGMEKTRPPPPAGPFRKFRWTQLAAIVYTSGSTGTPLPYRKTWGRLARCVRDGAPRMGLLDGRSHALIGTVPAQHMYGFESTVLLALVSGKRLLRGAAFFIPPISRPPSPRYPGPRGLITTPVHLRIPVGVGDRSAPGWISSCRPPRP